MFVLAEIEPTGTLGVICGGIVGLVAAFFAAKRFFVWFAAWRVKHAANLERERFKHETIELIARELSPNGGKTIKDKINAISEDVHDIKFWRRATTDLDHRAIFTTCEKGETVWANNAYLRLTQRSIHEIKGYQWMNCIHPGDRDVVRREWESAVRDQRNFELSYRYMINDNEVHVKCIAIYDKRSGYFGVVTPVLVN